MDEMKGSRLRYLVLAITVTCLKKKIIIPKPMQLYMYILLVTFSEQYFKDLRCTFT